MILTHCSAIFIFLMSIISVCVCVCVSSAIADMCDEKPAAQVPNAVPANDKFSRAMGASVPLVCSPGFKSESPLSSTCSCASDASATPGSGVWLAPTHGTCSCALAIAYNNILYTVQYSIIIHTSMDIYVLVYHSA